MELEVAQELQLERVDTPAPLKLFGQVIERLFQPCSVDRFRQIVVGAAAYSFDRGLNGVRAGHQDNEDAGIALQRLLQEREAVYLAAFSGRTGSRDTVHWRFAPARREDQTCQR